MKLKIITLFLGTIILLICSYFYRQQSLSFKFVDEEDNFTFGKYLSLGEKLYDDLISNHQPLTHIFSAQVQKFTHPVNGYFLVVRHREAIILWSIVWSLILIYQFGLAALIFVLIYELTKIHLLGNLFLAESFIVYPLVFLVGIIFEKELSTFQIILTGIASGLSIFLLLPSWPVLLLILAVLISKHQNSIFHFLKFFLIGLLLPIILTFIYSSIVGYFYYSILANFTYTIPTYQNNSLPISILKSFLSPVLSFFQPNLSPTLIVIRIFSLVLLINIFLLIKLKRLRSLILMLSIFGLLNIRFIWPGTEGYSGFHILPWYACFIFLISYFVVSPTKDKKLLKLNIVCWILVGAAIIFSIQKSGSLFNKIDPIKAYYINYSTYLSIADDIKIMKKDSDTLFVSPNAWLIYWQANIAHLPKLYGYYTWMSGFPPLQKRVLEAFENNSPTFFYCENCKGLTLEKYLYKYQQMQKNDSSTNLYVLNGKVKKLNTTQLNQLKQLHISF